MAGPRGLSSDIETMAESFRHSAKSDLLAILELQAPQIGHVAFPTLVLMTFSLFHLSLYQRTARSVLVLRGRGYLATNNGQRVQYRESSDGFLQTGWGPHAPSRDKQQRPMGGSWLLKASYARKYGRNAHHQSLEELFLSNSAQKLPTANGGLSRKGLSLQAEIHPHDQKRPPAQLQTATEDGQRLFRKLRPGQSGGDSSSHGWLNTMMEALDEASRKQDRKRVAQVWEGSKPQIQSGSSSTDPAKLDKLYVKFLSTSLALRQTEMAIAVWNFMAQEGHPFRNTHWTAMLHGCTLARDVVSLKEIWSNMLRSDVKPDIVAWTAYIYGLIRCGRWQEGLGSLDQLSKYQSRIHQEQAEAAQDRRPPLVSLINAVLDALIETGKSEYLNTVLTWAESQNIELETHTYNILLRQLARKGNLDAIQQHLHMMSDKKCSPDVATFTILLPALVGSRESPFHRYRAEEQEKVVLALLSEMEKHKITPNAYTYSAILSALLIPSRQGSPSAPTPSIQDPGSSSSGDNDESSKAHTGNLSAARAVLSHMHAHSVPPTPHIHTIFLSYHLSRTPPDITSVRTLWQTIRTSPGSSAKHADEFFYDRLIQGLADADEIEDAAAAVKQMAREGKRPGWVGLTKCLDAMCRAEDWRRLKAFVDEVERPQTGLLRWGQRELRLKGKWERTVERLGKMGLL